MKNSNRVRKTPNRLSQKNQAQTKTAPVSALPAPASPASPAYSFAGLEHAVTQALALMHLMFESDSWHTECGELEEADRDKYITGWIDLVKDTEDGLLAAYQFDLATARADNFKDTSFSKFDDVALAINHYNGLLYLMLNSELLGVKLGKRSERYQETVNAGLFHLVCKTTARLESAFDALYPSPAALRAAA